MANNIVTEPNLMGQRIDLVHEQTSTLEEILGEERPEIEYPLGLLAATVDVRIFESEEALFYRVNFPETLLLGQDLIKLLTYSRPANSVSEFGVQNRLEIHSDWMLPDRPDVFRQHEYLVKMHERLFDPHWSEFLSYHRAQFMDAVFELSEKEINEYFDTQIAKLVTKKNAVSNLELFIDEDHIRRILFSTYLFENRNIIRDWLHENKPDIREERIRGMEIDDLRSLIRELPQKLKKYLVEKGILGSSMNVVDIQGPAKLILNGSDGSYRISYKTHTRFAARFAVEYLGDRCVTIQLGDNLSFLHFNRGSFKEMERHIKHSYYGALIPLVLWSRDKNTGQRSYLSSDVPHILVEDLMQGMDKQSNTLLGLAALTYLSPNQRDQLPSKLHGRPMLEAQQLLVLLMNKDYLANETHLCPRVESLYQK